MEVQPIITMFSLTMEKNTVLESQDLGSKLVLTQTHYRTQWFYFQGSQFFLVNNA